MDDARTEGGSGVAVAERLHRRTMRRLIGALAGLAVAGSLAAGFGTASAASATPLSSAARTASPANAAAAAVRRFAAALPVAQRAALSGPTGTGVRLGDLAPGDRTAALVLLRGLLSPAAWEVVSQAMAADDALAASGIGEGSDGYRIGYLEEAHAGGFLQFAGPQLAINALLRGEEVVVEPELIQV